MRRTFQEEELRAIRGNACCGAVKLAAATNLTLWFA